MTSVRREKPRGDWVDVLDGVRAVLIFLVGWFHIWQQSWLTPHVTIGNAYYSLDHLLRSGYIWVDGMLLLSGFLLYLPYTRRDWQRGEGKRFFLRRFARIYPSYALNVLFFFFIRRGQYGSVQQMLVDLAAHLTFLHPLSYETYYLSPLNGALWTVGVEVHFYLLFPFICRAFRKKPVWTFAGMTAAAFAWRAYVATKWDTAMYFNQLPAFLDVYALGMAGAVCYTALRERLKGETGTEKVFFTLIAVVCVLFLKSLTDRQASQTGTENIRLGQMAIRFSLAAALTVLIVSLSFSLRQVRFLFSNRVMRFFAAISFQFYMYHQGLAVIIKEMRWIPSISDVPNQVGEQPWQILYTLTCFAVPIVLGAALTWGFEKPLRKKILAIFPPRADGKIQ